MDASAIHQRIEQAHARLINLRNELLKRSTELPDDVGRAIVQLEELSDELINQVETLEEQLSHEHLEESKDEEDLLAIEQARLNAIIETTTEGLIITDVRGEVVLANRAAGKIFNRTIAVGDRVEDLAKENFFTLDMQPNPEESFPLIRSIRQQETVNQEELYQRWGEGKLRRVKIGSRPLIDRHGRLIGMVANLYDVTEEHAVDTERRIRDAEQEAQRLLTRQREVERAEIAREIHDGPVQHLTLIRFNIEQALSMSYPNPSLEQIMRQISTGVDSGIDELRTLCNQLRPPTLAPYGLEKAIRSHARELRNRYVAPLVSLDLDPDQKRIPDEVRTALFRIYQESLTNAIKHASAGEVHVTLRLSERWAELTISDDGVGFSMPEHWVEFARDQHFGLVGMMERAEAIGGTLDVQSQVGKGTVVRARVPLQRPGLKPTA